MDAINNRMAVFFQSPSVMTEIVISRIEQLDINSDLGSAATSSLSTWMRRENQSNPSIELMRNTGKSGFSIGFDGRSDHYWPDRETTAILETIVRGFLFENGICKLTELTPFLYRVSYSLLALEGDELMLVCPFPTTDAKIAGLIVVDVDC